MREIITSRGAEEAASDDAILDVLTRNEIQFSALQAKVLGTFYESLDAAGGGLTFGSDIDTYYSASRYRVYKPFGRSLSIIARYPLLGGAAIASDVPDANVGVRIGEIRYSSTLRRRTNQDTDGRPVSVPVLVNIEDFIAMKTAVFGMTRLGKSNTMKTLATAIFAHSQRTGQAIGQLLFDPAGEYANVNVQDRTALSEIGPDHVTIYRHGGSQDNTSIRPLSLNFYSEKTIDVTWSVVRSELEWRQAQAGYIRDFLQADVIGPEREEYDRSSWNRAHQRRAAFFACLLKAGLETPAEFSVSLPVKKEIRDLVNAALPEELGGIQANKGGWIRLNRDTLRPWLDALVQAHSEDRLPEGWIDSQMDAILVMYTAAGIRGYRELQVLADFHSPTRQTDYAEEILEDLIAGKIVIVDLSLGTEIVLKYHSERVINYVLRDAASRFAKGEEPRNIQIYVEEAHRLFNRDRMHRPEEHDPYVRLAKEAAKYRIGLIYATQEVTSVDPIVLSNTSNWIVTHLNNRVEIRELSKYYDFEDFAELTLKSEDVGFVRMKTRSGRYIIPLQVDLFDSQRIEMAREAASEAGK
jgi:hypothetical protein